jgi:hypothetical protein
LEVEEEGEVADAALGVEGEKGGAYEEEAGQ